MVTGRLFYRRLWNKQEKECFRRLWWTDEGRQVVGHIAGIPRQHYRRYNTEARVFSSLEFICSASFLRFNLIWPYSSEGLKVRQGKNLIRISSLRWRFIKAPNIRKRALTCVGHDFFFFSSFHTNLNDCILQVQNNLAQGDQLRPMRTIQRQMFKKWSINPHKTHCWVLKCRNAGNQPKLNGDNF